VIRGAQLLLCVSALGLWVASRLPWVSLGSADGLGHPKTSTINGAAWSTALTPLAVLLLAAALAGLAVRGWLLRALAILVATVCVLLAYLGISLIVMPDVAPRGAELADVPVMDLVASQRHLTGAALTVAAAICSLIAAVLMMRAATSEPRRAAKYAGTAGAGEGIGVAEMSERGMWDALDVGRDPTDPDAPTTPVADRGTEGR